MKTLLMTCILLAILSSCGELESSQTQTLFDQPQPADVKNTTEFGKKIQGTYMNQKIHISQDSSGFYSDTTFLQVYSNSILSVSRFFLKQHRRDLDLPDSVKNLNNTALLSYITKEEGLTKAYFVADTLFCFTQISDTILKLSAPTILRYYKGSYFINTPVEPSGWEVTRLTPKKDYLLVSYLYAEDSITTDIEQITPVKVTTYEQDSSSYTFTSINPSRKEFKKLIKEDLFTTEKVYRKIR
ncbi:hypothetical protein QNI19_20555 [Cytophagaceae bacterium DM2B3-1]|uniref:Lipoprotein n=1 Tax=Xanthocytophaga flava TaxID=3048013 RepID=A0ABT7CNN6_9BACT|nr:hypothetical protein [Xanthocytophaga flavus]MDJ1495343.1 hypothetical protein [Xanthocytophaga flavus]